MLRLLTILIVLLSFSFVLCFEAKSEVIIQYIDKDNIKTRSNISTLNLVNGLYLNKKQMNDYLGILKRLDELESKYGNEIKIYQQKQNVVFKNLEDKLIANNGISEKTEKEAKGLDDKLKEVIIEYKKERQLLEKDLDKVFTQNQKIIISEYIPCVIPPESFKNPERIGQAENNEDVKKGLTDLRKANFLIYLVFRGVWVDKYLEFYQTHFKELSYKEKNLEKDRLYKIFDEARSLNDVDFEMKKDELAIRVTAKVFETLGDFRKYSSSKSGLILLNVNMIPIIEKRLQG